MLYFLHRHLENHDLISFSGYVERLVVKNSHFWCFINVDYCNAIISQVSKVVMDRDIKLDVVTVTGISIAQVDPKDETKYLIHC